jgi:autophagy-related protein 18
MGTENHQFSMSFNQDVTSLTVGTPDGYRLYNLGRIPDALDLLYQDNMTKSCKNAKMVKRLFTSSLVAYVSEDNPKRLYLTHFRKNQTICDYTYQNDISSIQLNRNRLIVVLDDNSIHIHAIKDMSLVHTLKDCQLLEGTNPNSAIALASPLSSSALSNLIAYPMSTESGKIAIFDCHLLRTIKFIDCHENCISAMSFANNSSYRAGSQDNPLYLATSGTRGTVIRVWAIPTGNLVKELRRGMYQAEIRQLSFSMDAQYLTLISNTSTVHIFDLGLENNNEEKSGEVSPRMSCAVTDEDIENEKEIDNSWYSYLTGIASSMLSITSSYLDATYQMTTGGVIERSKTTCRLPSTCSSETQAVAILQNMVLIATKNNKLLIYELNRKPDNFDECKLIREIDVEKDEQAPILNHSESKNKQQNTTDYSRAAKNSYLTRNVSREIEVDLSTS